MNSNNHWLENGLRIVPAMLAHCQQPVAVTTSLKKHLTHEYQWIASHGMTWLNNLLRGNTWMGAAAAGLIDWPAIYKVSCIHLHRLNYIPSKEVVYSYAEEWRMRMCDQSGGESSQVAECEGKLAGEIDRGFVHTCEVCVVWGIDEIVGEGKGHVLALVQLLRRDDAVFLPTQIPGKAFHWDLTCTNTTQHSMSLAFLT